MGKKTFSLKAHTATTGAKPTTCLFGFLLGEWHVYIGDVSYGGLKQQKRSHLKCLKFCKLAFSQTVKGNAVEGFPPLRVDFPSGKLIDNLCCSPNNQRPHV